MIYPRRRGSQELAFRIKKRFARRMNHDGCVTLEEAKCYYASKEVATAVTGRFTRSARFMLAGGKV